MPLRIRLDKLVSDAGIGSRKDVRGLILQGQVQVDGTVVREIGLLLDPAQSKISLNGKEIGYQRHHHIMLYKPSGLITAVEDYRSATIMELLPENFRKLGISPIGRLDKDTTGILLLTTDGQLAHRLISPKYHVDKLYMATVDGELHEDDIESFKLGIPLKDFTALPAVLEIIKPNLGKVIVQEGKYHQVKRMFGALGKPVIALHRTSFVSLSLDDSLPIGGYRPLTETEIATLYRVAGLEDN